MGIMGSGKIDNFQKLFLDNSFLPFHPQIEIDWEEEGNLQIIIFISLFYGWEEDETTPFLL